MAVGTLHRRDAFREWCKSPAPVRRRPDDAAKVNVAGRRQQVDAIVTAARVGSPIDSIEVRFEDLVSDPEKELRKQEIQKAFKQAALVPLEVANHAVNVIDLAGRAVDSGNKNAVTDGVVAAMNARTAALAALYNVKINLVSIEDDEFVKELTREINNLEQQAKSKEQEILASTMI